MKLATIDIDFDIHKLIEAERKSFEEPPFHALRRLLGLGAVPAATVDETPPDGRPWRDGPVEVPHGSGARMMYDRGRQVYEGKFLDGKLVVNGQEFTSLSSAAQALAVTKSGSSTFLNGWLYWEAKFPGETKWRRLDDLRARARGKRGTRN